MTHCGALATLAVMFWVILTFCNKISLDAHNFASQYREIKMKDFYKDNRLFDMKIGE